MGLVRSFIGTDGIWQYIPHINTGLFSIIKVHFLLFANLIVDWHINTINFTDSGIRKESRSIFEGLKITEHEEFCKKWMNQYPVLFLSFKGGGRRAGF